MGLVVEAFFIGENRLGGDLLAEEHRPVTEGLLGPHTMRS
jgi:hypothetical protein